MRRVGVLELGVGFAAFLSAGLLGVMLAAPWLPQSTGAPMPTTVATASESATPAPAEPPIGLYLLRGPLSFGPCLALELGAESYPVADDAHGTATVLWWQRGMTGCDARSNDVASLSASVMRVVAEDEDRLLGYALQFSLPTGFEPDAPAVPVEVTILAAQSTPELLQALETSSPGSAGLVFDRVETVAPALNPLPSQAPIVLRPSGLYLLQGPFDSDGPCLVLELEDASYPADPGTAGAAGIRWWERAVPDPDNPAECLTRRGDVHEDAASVMTIRDSGGTPIAYTVSFSLPLSGGEVEESVEIAIQLATSTRERLEGTVVTPEGVPPLVFDRVDSIDPPLAP